MYTNGLTSQSGLTFEALYPKQRPATQKLPQSHDRGTLILSFILYSAA